MKPLVSIIAVNFNHSHVTDELLYSIRQHNTYQPIEIIIVDNGSRENPVPEWAGKFPEARFIRSDVNLGFAGGNNLGIRQAKGDYLFLVNNDTEFTSGLIDTLIGYMESNPKVGVLSPKIRYFDQPDVLQYAGYTAMNYYTCRNACVGQFEKDNGQHDHLTGATGYAHGAAMMVRREALEKAGVMAENFFLYYEELDWCEMFKRAGYEIHVNMQALIYHKESISVGKKSALKEYFMNRNRILFTRRNAPLPARLLFPVFFAGVVMPRNLLQYVREKNFNFISPFLKAIRWNLVHSKNSEDLGYKVG